MCVPMSSGSQRTTLGIVLREHSSYFVLFLSQSFSLAWNFPIRPGWPNGEPRAHSCLPLLYWGGTRYHNVAPPPHGFLEVFGRLHSSLYIESSVLSPLTRCPKNSVPHLPSEILLVFVPTRAEPSREKRSHPPSYFPPQILSFRVPL